MAAKSRTRRRWVVALIPLGVIALAGLGVWWLEIGSQKETEVSVEMPSQTDLTAVAQARVLFGHQSVGSNVLAGIEAVYATGGGSVPTITETSGGPVTGDAFIAHSHIGENGDPLGKFDAFSSLIAGSLGDEVDIALAKLCYTDIIASTDVPAVFDAYVEMMQRVESSHPDVTFLYTTVPLSTDRDWKANLKALVGMDDHMGPADNVAREQYNALIRDRFGATGRLFDIAAVESTLDSDPMERSLDGTAYFVLNRALSSDAGHLNEQGGKVAASELITLMAANLER